MRIGRPLPAETRQKMSEAHRRRGTRPPGLNPSWTAKDDIILGMMPDNEVAQGPGRTVQAVGAGGACSASRRFWARGGS
jgi:hypothetical protein